MNATANAIAAVLRKTEGAVDVRVEQTEGLPMLDIRPRRDIMSRLGITAQTVQDTISAAIGGRDAGMIFEGDRRFAITIRLSDVARANLQTLGQVRSEEHTYELQSLMRISYDVFCCKKNKS